MNKILLIMGDVSSSIDDSLGQTGEEPAGVGDFVQSLVSMIMLMVGIIAVVMIVVGAIQYTMSQGDAGKVKKAKDTIMYGIIGLVVALLAFAIVRFALSGMFGA